MLKNVIKIIIIFNLIIISFSCKKDRIEEKEGNNAISTANEIEPGKEIYGYLDSAKDTDYFKVNVDQPLIFDINLSAVKGINHAIQIWKKDSNSNRIIKKIDDYRKSSSERMNNLYVEQGVYYLQILHGDRDIAKGNKNSPYTLLITTKVPENEELEPNDKKGEETIITPDIEYIGFYSPAFNKLNKDPHNKLKELDRFAINIECSEDNPILLDVVLTGVADVNSILSLYGPDDKLIQKVDTGDTGADEFLKDVGLKLTGRYVIIVTNKNFGSNNNIPYRLKASIKNYDSGSEMEPNNRREEANIIFDNNITARIQSENDIDYFQFKPENKNFYSVKITPPANNQFKVNIYNETGIELFKFSNNSNEESAFFPDIYINEPIYLKVEKSGGILNVDAFYNISFELLSETDGMEIEPNNVKESATLIEGNLIKGFASMKDDNDFYLIDYGKNIRKKFIVKGINDSTLEVSITDNLGFIIKTVTVKNEDPVEFEETIDNKAYIIVKCNGNSKNEPYIIEIGE